jgi:hypothetical protein
MATKKEKLSPLMQVYLDQQTAPKITESAGDSWIQYGNGAYKNLYPQFIIDLYNSSPTHAAVVNATSAMIAGDAIVVDEGAEDNLEAYVKLKRFFANANRKETLHEVITKIAFDLKLQGGFALNIIWSQDRTEIAEIYHIPLERIRCGKLNEMGQIDEYWLSADWARYRQTGYLPQPMPAFNPNDRTEPSQILYKGIYSPGMEVYHTPDYQAGTNWCLTDQLISEFHLSNIRNGFSPNFWINFNNGIPTAEERYDLEQKIQKKFTGASNAGKFVLTFSDDKSREPTLMPISLTDADKQYEILNKLVIQNIMIAHRVTSPMLLGVKTEGQLGGRTELLDAYELYHNTVIAPFQSVIMKCLRYILDVNDINLPVSIQKSAPMSNKFGPDVLKEVMTRDELREELGLPALEAGEDTAADEEMERDKEKKQKYSSQEDLEAILATFGEDEAGILTDYDLLSEEDVNDEDEDQDYEALLNEGKVELAVKSGKGYPNRKSKQDGKNKKGQLFRVRYVYSSKGGHAAERDFCKLMMRSKKVYRKEDIKAMSRMNVNPGFGPSGKTNTYSIWLYKGGVNCYHRWYRKIYIQKGTKAINDDEVVSTTKSRSKGFAPPANERAVPVAPIDMPRKGRK